MNLRWLAWMVVGLVPAGCIDDPLSVITDSESGTTEAGTTMSQPTTLTSSSTTVDPSISTTLTATESDSETSTGIVVETSSTGEETSGTTVVDTEGNTTGSTGNELLTSGTTGSTSFNMEDTGIIFIDPTGGIELECDLWEQDCPDMEKCSPWANDGGNSWNAWRCVPLADDPAQAGDSCTVEGSGVSGIDDCDISHMCWDIDPETNMGFCIAFCEPPEAAPTCADPDAACVVTNDGILPLCLPGCDPFLNDCAGTGLCVPVDGNFVCAPDASGEMGAYGDPCEFLNVCDAGLMCAEADDVPGCAASGCCTPYCDLDEVVVCPGVGQECVPFFDVGMEPPGMEDVGICGIPA